MQSQHKAQQDYFAQLKQQVRAGVNSPRRFHESLPHNNRPQAGDFRPRFRVVKRWEAGARARGSHYRYQLELIRTRLRRGVPYNDALIFLA